MSSPQTTVALPTGVAAALEFATRIGSHAFVDGPHATRERIELLTALGAHDLGVARAVEPHLDAMDILAEAGLEHPDGSWGVFAAEGGDDPLCATNSDAGWTLTGTKPWCSLADRLDAALISATTPTGDRRLFAVDLTAPGVQPLAGSWHARGLTEIPSGPVRFASVAAAPVGGPGWYLTRPGFAVGGIGVAACWYGGAIGIARSVHAAAAAAGRAAKPAPFLLAHLGAIDEGLETCRRALTEAADWIDAGAVGDGHTPNGQTPDDPTPDGPTLALRVRATVARVSDDVIVRAGHALGPSPLATDEAHAKRVADLQLYVRQHHAERDLESLGRAIADGPAPW